MFDVPGWKLSSVVDGSSGLKTSNKNNKSLKDQSKKRDTPVADDVPNKKSSKKRSRRSIKESNSSLKQISVEMPAEERESLVKVDKNKEKLAGARFRHLNQRLYEISSEEAVDYFQKDPKEFVHYHVGFRSQTKQWPVNPVDLFCDRLTQKIDVLSKSKKACSLVIADVGCGEAQIARRIQSKGPVSVEMHSFDLVACNASVTVANMSSLPLQDESVDIAVYSLSLMNTDYSSALDEATRILKSGTGQLWIAEVSSRFERGSLEQFIEGLRERGFAIRSVDQSNKVFVMISATKKQERQSDAISFPTLKACLYKKR